MSKPSVQVHPPAKLKRFAQTTKRWEPVADYLKAHPWQWVTIKGAKEHDAPMIRNADRSVFLPAGAFEARKSGNKIKARFVGTSVEAAE